VPPTRLLIVEDSELTASALRLLFEESGYDVAVAANVKQAVAIGMERALDVMLLDLTLTDGDGLTVLGRLREEGRAPRSTIALTGYDDDDVRQRCFDAGCVDVLLKPVPIARLLELLRSL
jgi:two-component system capsular synthesis sensor histidine kinase RcsC